MTFRNTLFLLCALSSGFVITPTWAGDIISCDSFENCPDGSVPVQNAILAMQAEIDALKADNVTLKADNEEFKSLLAGVTRLTDPNTDQDTLRFSNMNVQVVSGSGATDAQPNGTGNLIIGYNEMRGLEDDRSGSHTLVIGKRHNYTAYGGTVIGLQNTASSIYASVTGGSYNTASSNFASVSGGYHNTASGSNSSVSGGSTNTASGYYASVGGGEGNIASGESASVSGGSRNTASGSYSSVNGGSSKTAATSLCTVGDDGVNC